MSRRITLSIVATAAILTAAGAHAEDADAVFTRFKSESGGARWDELRSLRAEGALNTGGLEGVVTELQDLATGRSVEHDDLKTIHAADGFDGRTGWSLDPGGEVAPLQAPEAIRRALTQAWLDARGYWYPARRHAGDQTLETRLAEGRSYQVVTAHPDGGDPVVLWFDGATGLLSRIEQRQGPDTATTLLDDYREVDGLRLPYRQVTDLTDTAGRTDPRRRETVQFAKYELNPALSDADFSMPAMKVTAHIGDPSGIARVPFELINNHIYVRGAVNGSPVRLMVDTGGINLLTPAAARRLGLLSIGKLAASGVGEQREDLGFAHAREISVGSVTLTEPVIYVIDLGQLPSVEGTPIDGLVGYEMFRRFGVQIDYAHLELTVTEPAKFVPPAGASAIAFDLNDRIPIISGTLDGLPSRITVDTGSRSALTLSAPFVREHDLLEKYAAAPESVTGWGVGGPARSHPARFGTLRLGDLDIVGIAGDLFTGTKGGITNPDQSANLGGGVLRQFTVAFDYENRKMYLAPNANFGHAGDFDRSGVWLLADRGPADRGPRGYSLRVADVAADSAAMRAGLHAGDRIKSIAGASVATGTLSDWRQMLRVSPVGTPIELELERGNRTKTVTLVLADRIPAVFTPGQSP